MSTTADDTPMAIGFVIELPIDLGLPNEIRLPVWRPDAWPEWNVTEWCSFAQVDRPSRPGQARLEHLVVLRSATVGRERPLRAADVAFGELDEASLQRWKRWTRRASLALLKRKPIPSRRSVAAIWRFVHDEAELLADGDEHERQVRWSVWIVEAIAVLDAWLVALGIAVDDPRLAPLSESEVGTMIPVVLATCTHQRGIVPLGSLVLPTRSEEPSPHRDGSDVALARAIFEEVMLAEGPFSVMYELVQQAGSARAAGRDRSAIIDYSTAGEVLIATVVDQVLALRGESESKRAGLRLAPFANVVRDHLGPLLAVNSDPRDREAITAAWWMHCYLRRNAIVHEGARANTVDSEMARIGLVMLAAEIRDALTRDPATAPLGAQMMWGHVHDETGEHGDPAHDDRD